MTKYRWIHGHWRNVTEPDFTEVGVATHTHEVKERVLYLGKIAKTDSTIIMTPWEWKEYQRVKEEWDDWIDKIEEKILEALNSPPSS